MIFAIKGIIANIVLHDIDTNFHGKQSEMLISWKWRTLAQNCVMSFIDFDICHRMAPLRILCSVALTFTFKVKHIFVVRVYNQNRATTADVPGGFASTRAARVVELFLFP